MFFCSVSEAAATKRSDGTEIPLSFAEMDTT